MTIGEIIAIAGMTGSAGMLVGWGITWGKTKQTIVTLISSLDTMRMDMVSHHLDRRIHIDPDRDIKAESAFRESVTDSFGDLKESIRVLNSRCEKRGADCAVHFGKIESRIAAATGKTNGESGK